MCQAQVLPSTHPTACVFLLNSCACMSSVQQFITSMLSNSVNTVKITADPRLPVWTDTKILLQLFTGCLLALQIGSLSKFLSIYLLQSKCVYKSSFKVFLSWVCDKNCGVLNVATLCSIMSYKIILLPSLHQSNV